MAVVALARNRGVFRWALTEDCNVKELYVDNELIALVPDWWCEWTKGSILDPKLEIES
jgi:hypothetical protein